MTALTDIQKNVPAFLVELYRRTQGDPSAQASMYVIGEALGLDRQTALRTAEELIGTGLADIRTLSGGIGITAEGVAKAQQMEGPAAGAPEAEPALGDAPILNQAAIQAVERVTAELKTRLGQRPLGFELLAEIMADLKSIDAQLSSPRPKTAIVRACLKSISAGLQSAADAAGLSAVNRLLGD